MNTTDGFFPRRKNPCRSVLTGLGLLGTLMLAPLPAVCQTQSVIVQGPDLASAKAAVTAAGGTVTHELRIIGAVGARLSTEQVATIQADKAYRVHVDGKVKTGPPVVPD